MTETITEYTTESQVIEPANELIELNLKVAAIAGWTEIRELCTNLNQEIQPKKQLYAGKNDSENIHGFIPDYVGDLNAIFAVFKSLDLRCSVSSQGAAWNFTKDVYAETPAIALCKLLLEINPMPETNPEAIEATFS